MNAAGGSVSTYALASRDDGFNVPRAGHRACGSRQDHDRPPTRRPARCNLDQSRHDSFEDLLRREPAHPALTTDQYDPRIGDDTFFEGRVVWDIFLWMLTTVTPHHPVVADSPFNHPWNREMFAQAVAAWDFPVAEVALHGDGETLLGRARLRATQPGVHEIKRRFSVRPEMYECPYQPVLDAARVVEVDTTNLDDVDPEQIAQEVRGRLGLE